MSIDSLLKMYDEHVVKLALSARQLVFDNVKDIKEQVDLPANMLGYSLGPGYKGTVCTLILSKKGVKMGFYRASELNDPTQLLRGSGKVHKYAELYSQETIQSPALKALLKEAGTACKKRLV